MINIGTGPTAHNLTKNNIFHTDVTGFEGQEQRPILPDLSDLFQQTPGTDNVSGASRSESNSTFSYQPIISQGYGRMK